MWELHCCSINFGTREIFPRTDKSQCWRSIHRGYTTQPRTSQSCQLDMIQGEQGRKEGRTADINQTSKEFTAGNMAKANFIKNRFNLMRLQFLHFLIIFPNEITSLTSKRYSMLMTHLGFVRHLSWHILMKNWENQCHTHSTDSKPGWDSLRYNYKWGAILKQVHFYQNLLELSNLPFWHQTFLQRFESRPENVPDAICR